MGAGAAQAQTPTLAKITSLTILRRVCHKQPQTPACNGVYLLTRPALVITGLGLQQPRADQVSMNFINEGAGYLYFSFRKEDTWVPWSTLRSFQNLKVIYEINSLGIFLIPF